jgi:hypothetical protein
MTRGGIGLRLWTSAAIVRVLKHVWSLPGLVRLFHTRAVRDDPATIHRLEQSLQVSGRFPRRAPSNCLERSLGAYRILCRCGARPLLMVGVRRTASNVLDGHVWVNVDGRPFGDSEERTGQYALTTVFDANGRRLRDPSGESTERVRFA